MFDRKKQTFIYLGVHVCIGDGKNGRPIEYYIVPHLIDSVAPSVILLVAPSVEPTGALKVQLCVASPPRTLSSCEQIRNGLYKPFLLTVQQRYTRNLYKRQPYVHNAPRIKLYSAIPPRFSL